MANEDDKKAAPVPGPVSGGEACVMFPAGLRVLVVDDDPLCLKVVEQMLKHCNYQGRCLALQMYRWGWLSDFCFLLLHSHN